MRIGLLTTSYPRHDSDVAGRFVAELTAALAHGGDAVEVIAPAPAISEQPGVTLHPVRYYLRRPTLFHGAGAPDNLFGVDRRRDRLRAWCQIAPYLGGLLWNTRRHGRGWDGVISHWLLPSAAAVALAAPKLPHLAVAHSSDVHLLARLPAAVGATLLARMARQPASLVLTSEGLRPKLAALAADPPSAELVSSAAVQPMGVPAIQPVSAEVVAELRRAHGLEGRTVVLFVGRLVPVKGVDRLLRAAAAAGDTLIPVIVGDGPERPALEQLAGELGVEARFVGVQTGAAKQAWYQAADLFCLPSVVLPDGRTDSAPVVVAEAMLAGLPVIASDVGGVRDLVGEDGVLVPPDDVPALGRALAALADNAGQRQELGARAALGGRRFTWERIAPALRAELARLCLRFGG